MTLKNTQYDTIMREYNRRQLHHKHILDQHIARAYQEIPRLAQIDSDIAALSLKKAKILLSMANEPDFDLQDGIEQMAQERQALLRSHGYPADYLTLGYDCPLCSDTGFINGQKCSCFKRAEIDLLYTQSNIREILQEENFGKLSFDYYSTDIINPLTGQNAQETAKAAYEKIQQFISGFGSDGGNLFFYGDTGVGKTFFSHCIAAELISQAFCVIYFTAFDLFESLAKSKFTTGSTDEQLLEQNQHIFDCDLLIIDDLGTELTNSFVSSQLFMCINERLMRKKSTIISTNLTAEQFMDRYSERTFSRIFSNYAMIKLIGKDIRIQKKLSGGKNDEPKN